MKKYFVCIDTETVNRFRKHKISATQLIEKIQLHTASKATDLPYNHRTDVELNKKEQQFLNNQTNKTLLILNGILKKFAQAGFSVGRGA